MKRLEKVHNRKRLKRFTITMFMDRRKFHFTMKCIHLHTQLINTLCVFSIPHIHPLDFSSNICMFLGGLFPPVNQTIPTLCYELGNKIMWSVFCRKHFKLKTTHAHKGHLSFSW